MNHLIIGCGVAGITAAQNIRKLDAKSKITIFTDEPYPFYSRIRLVEFLAGGLAQEALYLKKMEWYRENRIELVTGVAASFIDPAAQYVSFSDGRKGSYDRLLLATGGAPFFPPVAGRDKDNVFTLRTLNEAKNIIACAKTHRRVLIIGGGLLGLECGNSLLKAGNDVSIVEFFPRLLPRQMDIPGAAVLETQMKERGLQFHLGVKPKEIIGNSAAEGLLLEDGRIIGCDMVLVSAGIRPNTSLAGGAGLATEKGVVVNDRMETSGKSIFAAGDLIEHRETVYGIWTASEKQGETAGINMAGGNASYGGTTMSNSLKVAGISLFSAGEIDVEGRHESIVREETSSYRKLVIDGNRIIGAIMYGDANGRMNVLNAITSKKDIGGIRSRLESWDLTGL